MGKDGRRWILSRGIRETKSVHWKQSVLVREAHPWRWAPQEPSRWAPAQVGRYRRLLWCLSTKGQVLPPTSSPRGAGRSTSGDLELHQGPSPSSGRNLRLDTCPFLKGISVTRTHPKVERSDWAFASTGSWSVIRWCVFLNLLDAVKQIVKQESVPSSRAPRPFLTLLWNRSVSNKQKRN